MILKKGDITRSKGIFKPKAVIFMVDEMNEVMMGTGGKSFQMVSNIQDGLGSIARLGRAAGCHLVLATQRPSSNVINSDMKNNIQQSVLLGDFDSNSSTLIFDSDISHMAKPSIKGRGFIKNSNEIVEFQSYYAEVDKILTENHGVMEESLEETKDNHGNQQNQEDSVPQMELEMLKSYHENKLQEDNEDIASLIKRKMKEKEEQESSQGMEKKIRLNMVEHENNQKIKIQNGNDIKKEGTKPIKIQWNVEVNQNGTNRNI